MDSKQIIEIERYVRKLDQQDLYQEWSVADLVWLINQLHTALVSTLTNKEGDQQ